MSPEQAQGQPVDPRSDVYSLGVVFYEMVTGRKPYQADTPMAVIWKLASEPLPSPRKFQPSLPDRVEAVLVKVLARNPQNRFQSMSDLVKVLSQLNTERPSVVFDRRGLRFWAGAGVLTVLAVTAFVWWWSVARLPSVRLPETSDGTDPSEVSPGAGATPTDAVSISMGETSGTYLMDLTPLTTRATHDFIGYGVYPWSEGPMSEGEPIFIFGRFFEHAIFAHAPSSLTYDLGGDYERLQTQIYYFGPCQTAIDGAIFRIFGDNELLYESPILNYGKSAVTVDVPVTNVDQLLLATDPLSDESCDWTIWLEPMLTPSRQDITRTATP
jgi:serine/threonine protein kinase